MSIKSLKIYILLTSIISSIITMVLIVDNIHQLYLLPTISLVYGITYYLLIPNKTIIGAGFTMMNIVLFFRYVVHPPLFIFQSYDSNLGMYLNQSVIIMIIEIFTILLTVRAIYNTQNKRREISLNFKRVNLFIPLILGVLGFFIYLGFPDIYANRHFILNSESIATKKTLLPGVFLQLMKWMEFFVITYLFGFFYKKYCWTNNAFWYYGSVFIIIIPCLFFSGNSRLSLLMPLVCCLFVLKKTYGAKSNKLIQTIALYGFISLSILSSQKFFGEVSSSVIHNLSFEENAYFINNYFGGLENVMFGLKAYDHNGASLTVLINDLFRNAMGISDFFSNNTQNSVSIFNSVIYESLSITVEDQICPTIIEGLFIFGPFLCFIPTIVLVYTTCWLDKKWTNSNSLEYSYLYAYLAPLIGWCVPGNLMHLSGSFFNVFVPISILILLNNSFSKSRPKYAI